jgi:toxin ParE1/3/4
MPAFRITPDAQSDLLAIRRFTISEWGVEQSRKYLDGLRQTIMLLAETPLLGRTRPDVGEKVFSFPHGSHVIYYLLHRKQLVVFAVLHKRMVPMNHLQGPLVHARSGQ